MKPGIHPDYHPVVFKDATPGAMFLTRSTITSSRTIEWQTPDGCRPTHLSSLKSALIHTRFGPADAVLATAPDKSRNSTAATAAGNRRHSNAAPTPRSEQRSLDRRIGRPARPGVWHLAILM
jgi:ribosomal protein L31